MNRYSMKKAATDLVDLGDRVRPEFIAAVQDGVIAAIAVARSLGNDEAEVSFLCQPDDDPVESGRGVVEVMKILDRYIGFKSCKVSTVGRITTVRVERQDVGARP